VRQLGELKNLEFYLREIVKAEKTLAKHGIRPLIYKQQKAAGCESISEVSISIPVSWDRASFRILDPYSTTLKTEAASTSETLVLIYDSVLSHNHTDWKFQTTNFSINLDKK
jgi:hypothetical protein